jgi:hypothetical protein
MESEKDVLALVASEQFEDTLAQAIAEEMEADAVTAQAESGFPTPPSEGSTDKSAETLFLANWFYSKLGVGKFSGRVTLIWNGMDNFVLIPNPDNPFFYVTSEGRKISPKIMNTDGGSIPRVLRGLKKYSSWGYAPAFMIHDWLFVAHKHHHEPDTDWTFPQSAYIMAEAIKTLMEVGYQDFKGNIVTLEKSEDTLYLMYLAVRSFVAEKLWNEDDIEEKIVCPSCPEPAIGRH